MRIYQHDDTPMEGFIPYTVCIDVQSRQDEQTLAALVTTNIGVADAVAECTQAFNMHYQVYDMLKKLKATLKKADWFD